MNKNKKSYNKGKNNGNYIDNRTNTKHYCKELDCNNEISLTSFYGQGRCRSCANKYKGKFDKNFKKKQSLNWRKEKNPSFRKKKYGNLNPNFGNHKLAGKNNPNYINGKGRKPYPMGFNKQLKEQIRLRDNYQCQLCGVKQKDYYRKLDVHHINYDTQNCNNDNLITLCNRCNPKVNFNRDYWYAYFTYQMEKK